MDSLELLRALPADQRAAVRARVIDGLDYSEAADVLGCSEMVVRQRVSRGLRRLRASGGPAMSTLPQLRDSVVAAAERRAREGPTREPGGSNDPGGRRWRRTLLISIAVGLVPCRRGLCQWGDPVRDAGAGLAGPAVHGADHRRRSADAGDGAHAARLDAGSGRWSAVGHARVHDEPRPRLRRGRRLAEGKLVAVGQDYAFGNDGRYHVLGVPSGGAGSGDWCSALDRYDRLFINQMWGEQPASAWQSRCFAPGSPPGGHMRHEPECPMRDERNLYFGLLGPDAESVTYVLGGQHHTLATSGPEGAYLIVTRSTPGQLLDRRRDRRGRPDRRADHRNPLPGRRDLPHHLQELDRRSLRVHAEPQRARRLRRAARTRLHAPQVATPVHATLIRTHGGRYELRLAIRSRVALRNAASGYNFAWYVPGTRFENHGTYHTEANIAAGQIISTTTCPLPAGYIHGTVSLYEPNEPYTSKSEVVYAYKYEKTGELVGGFAVHVPGKPSHTSPESTALENRGESPLASCSRTPTGRRGRAGRVRLR